MFAQILTQKYRFHLNSGYWAGCLIERAAEFVTKIRSGDNLGACLGDLLYEPIGLSSKGPKHKNGTAYINVRNPLFVLATLFLDELTSEESRLTDEVADLLIAAMNACYHEIGGRIGKLDWARRLSKAFATFVRQLNTPFIDADGEDALHEFESGFLLANCKFFTYALESLAPKRLEAASQKSELVPILDKASTASRFKSSVDLLYPFAEIDCLERTALSQPVFDLFRSAIQMAMLNYQKWRGSHEGLSWQRRIDKWKSKGDRKRRVVSDSEISLKDKFKNVIDLISESCDGLSGSKAFYNCETKVAPPVYVSEQLDPKGGALMRRINFFVELERPEGMSQESFLHIVELLTQKAQDYLDIVESCATTEHLATLTRKTERKLQMLMLYYSNMVLSDDTQMRGALHSKTKLKFQEFGQALLNLYQGFCEYESQVTAKPLSLVPSRAFLRASERSVPKAPRRLNLPGSQVEKHARYCKWILDCLEDYRRRFRDTYKDELENRITRHLYLPSVEDIAAWIRNAKKDATITRRKIENTLFHALGTTVNWYAFRRNLGRQAAQERQQSIDSKRNARRTGMTVKPRSYRVSNDYTRINPDIVMYWDHLATDSEFVLIKHRPSASAMFDCEKYLAVLTAELQKLFKDC